MKQQKSGFTIIELLIVIAIIGILAGLVLTNFKNSQNKARDAQSKNRVNSLHDKLEEYYIANGGYPDGVLSQTVLPGIDANALLSNDTVATAVTQTYSTSAPAAPTTSSTNGQQYYYTAGNCVSATAQNPVGSTCSKYILSTYLQTNPGLFTRTSLN